MEFLQNKQKKQQEFTYRKSLFNQTKLPYLRTHFKTAT